MPSFDLTEADKDLLLQQARRSIEYFVENGEMLRLDSSTHAEYLRAEAATFVTLHLREHLRGCVGTTDAYQPLIDDVIAHAHAAAFRDYRFQPVSAPELEDITIEVSVLSTPEALQFESEPHLLKQLRPGCDGLTIAAGRQKATFLPTVWNQLQDKHLFLRQLIHKAGLPANQDVRELSAWRYQTVVFSESRN